MADDLDKSDDPRLSSDIDVLRAEIDRLRDLVGPTEASYADLQQELAAAHETAKQQTIWAGTYRGRTIQLTSQLQRHTMIEHHLRSLLRPPVRALRAATRSVRRRRPMDPIECGIEQP